MNEAPLDPQAVLRLRDSVREDLAQKLGELCASRGALTEAERLRLLDELLLSPAGPGRRLGRYELVQEIGRGGIGTVYKAYDTQLQRLVALKTLRLGIEADLAREAQTAARLKHPNVVTVYDGGEIDGVPFLCMEYVEGAHLGELVRGRRLPLEALVGILRKAAEGVAYAHAQGIVHRDLKPGNILVDADREPRVIDFGLARLMDHRTFLAVTGSPIGTPYYMSPEQVRDAASVGPSSDVYSLGVCLYEILTGRVPFEGSDAYPVFESILRGDPPPPRSLHPGLSPDLETICLKAMDRDPRRRYATATEFAEDLSRFLKGEPIAARPPAPIERALRWVSRHPVPLALSAAAILVLAIGGWALQSVWRVRASGAHYRLLRERLKPLEAMIQETRPFFYIRSADVAGRLGKVQSMLDDLEKEAGASESAEVWATLGVGWYFAGDLPRSERALLKAQVLAPEEGTVHAYLGRISLDRAMIELATKDGRPDHDRQARAKELNDRALAHFRRQAAWGGAQEIDRHLATAYRALAEGNAGEAARLCREGMSRFDGELGVEEFSCLLGSMTEGEERLVHLSRAIEKRPHYPWALLQRGSAWLVQKELDRALEDLDRAIALNPRLAYGYNDRGLVRYSKGEFDAAIADFDRALALDPGLVLSILNRGIARAGKGDFAGAIADCDRAIELNPTQACAYQNRGTFRRLKGDLQGARADAERMISLAPGLAAGYTGRGLVRAAMGDGSGALADYAKAIEIDPRHAEAFASRGVARLTAGERPGAMADLTRALAIDPRHSTASYYRGSMHAEEGRVGEAMADFTESIRSNGSNAPAYASRGILWEGLRKLDRAIEDYDAALKINPRYPDAFYNRGIAREQKGDLDGAIADFERALELAPEAWNSRDLARRSLEAARRKRQE